MKVWMQGVVWAVVVSGGWVAGQQELPEEAKVVVEKLERELQEIQKKADEEAKATKERHVLLLKELQDKFAKESKLDEAVAVRDFLKNLQLGYTALPAPENLVKYGDKVGQTFYFEVTGATNGSVYGSDIYPTNSNFAASAVHAGAVRYGEKAVVKVTIMPGKGVYSGYSRNGVDSRGSSEFASSFRVERAMQDEPKVPEGVEVLAAPSGLNGYAGQPGKVLYLKVTGSTTGTVYGTDIYTTDSNPAAAVVHAGLLKTGETGIIKVTIMPSATIHTGSSRNGVTSGAWGIYNGSYKMELVKE